MKLIKLKNNIIQLDFETQEELAKTFIRFQEHYESSKFRGKVFTLGQFKEWYSKKYGGFTYYQDWVGFNIPSKILDIFRTGIFDPLTKEEQKILELIPTSLEPFYVIGTFKGGEKDTLAHEICHGMYYSNPEYRSNVEDVITFNYKALKDVFKFMTELGYHKDVHVDEVHAYVGVDYKYLEEVGVKYPENVRDRLLELRKLYKV